MKEKSLELMMDKNLYEGEDVICKEPWDFRIIEGYSGAFCKCGRVLHIKTPRRKAFHAIKCPMCGYIVNLFCGEQGEPDYSFERVMVKMPDGTIIEGECTGWKDWENGDMIQVTIGGKTYLTHSNNVVLISED